MRFLMCDDEEKTEENRAKTEKVRFWGSWFVNWIEGERRIERFLGFKGVGIYDDVE